MNFIFWTLFISYSIYIYIHLYLLQSYDKSFKMELCTKCVNLQLYFSMLQPQKVSEIQFNAVIQPEVRWIVVPLSYSLDLMNETCYLICFFFFLIIRGKEFETWSYCIIRADSKFNDKCLCKRQKPHKEQKGM